MDNPLLNQGPLPAFSQIKPEDVVPAITTVLKANREQLSQLLKSHAYSWKSLMDPLEDTDEALSKVWSPVSHLHSVKESKPLRKAYRAVLPLLTEYQTELLHNETLYKAILSIKESTAFDAFDDAQKKIIDNALRDFRLAGVHFSPEKKSQFLELQKELSELSTHFSENILDATKSWVGIVTDKSELQGLSQDALVMSEENAIARGIKGWVLTLDLPFYSAAMKSLSNRELRKKLYEAFVTRASDQGPDAGKFDNSNIMQMILMKRKAMAELLDFSSYAAYSLATKMMHSTEEVLAFLQELVDKSKLAAEREMEELRAFANKDAIENLEAWDLSYYSEKLREARYAISQEEVRAYFPIDTVLSGMFTIINKLFGITIEQRAGVDVWDPEVKFFEIRDRDHQLLGAFYTDLYARPSKKEGAWMDDARTRRRLPDGSIQTPIAFLTCNFMRPVNGNPALLTHEDVQTLFHEFGHCLHHLLTKVDYTAVAGIHGVPWDAVEFPSQFLESWCWEKEGLKLISSHVDTGETMPDSLYNKLIASKFFQGGLQMLRQLEFAIFDFRLHLDEAIEDPTRIQTLLDEVRKNVSVIHSPPFNRFQHSFSHIFAGGYAAGYYGYKWSEVLSSDAFSLFEEKGIFNQELGQQFLKLILEQGGVYEPLDLFIQFRGRPPTIDALIEQSGLKV